MTKIVSTLFLLALASTLPKVVSAQGTPQATKDPQAVMILAQSLQAVGGVQAVNGIQDFTGTGTITYFWGGKEIQGPATVRARGYAQFRLDANLPEGTRSYVINQNKGWLREAASTVQTIPFHNVVNVNDPVFPYQTIAARLSDPLATIINLGLVKTETVEQLQGIRVQYQFPPDVDPQGQLTSLCVTDYFIDPATLLIVKAINKVYAKETTTRNYPHEIDFEGYAAEGGIKMPMVLREKIDQQTTWEFQMNSVSFNTGLSDSNFTIQ